VLVLPFTFYFLPLFYLCETENLQTLQTPVSGKQRDLPELPWALHLESGIVGQCRLFAGHDFADFYDCFYLDFFLFRDFFQV